jgi:nitrogen fixation protein NifQ
MRIAVPEATAHLRRQALAGVVRLARSGDLPPFALWMGLEPSEWQAMARDSMIETQPFCAGAPAPAQAAQLAALMLARRSPGADARHAAWLAHAIAAASHGKHHLWQDLGLTGRTDVSALMQCYFEPLYLANVHDLKWKRFLYQQLGAALGHEDLRAPGCASCGDFGRCYPDGPA